MKSLDEIISDNLKFEIIKSSKTQRQIAFEIGVSPQVVNQYCTGRSQPSLSTLTRLCKCLDISADDILNSKERKPEE